MHKLAPMYYKETEETPRCLNCGKPVYGRPDKKYCSAGCKSRFNYVKVADSMRIRRKVMSDLSNNYTLLEYLIEKGIRTVELPELEDMGFKPGCVTGFRKIRGGVEELRCFDISYRQSPSCISRIARIKTAGPPPPCNREKEDLYL